MGLVALIAAFWRSAVFAVQRTCCDSLHVIFVHDFNFHVSRQQKTPHFVFLSTPCFHKKRWFVLFLRWFFAVLIFTQQCDLMIQLVLPVFCFVLSLLTAVLLLFVSPHGVMYVSSSHHRLTPPKADPPSRLTPSVMWRYREHVISFSANAFYVCWLFVDAPSKRLNWITGWEMFLLFCSVSALAFPP